MRTKVAGHLRRCGASLQTSHRSHPLLTQQRFVEYWGMGVTGRTQPYAQGDMLPRLDNMRQVVNKSSSTAAALTGSHVGIAYDSGNIFSVEGYSEVERDHYQPLRGLNKYVVDPLAVEEGPVTANILRALREEGSSPNLEELWWGRVLKDFPSMSSPCTDAFKTAWADFYDAAFMVAHNDAAVIALATPFMREQLQKHYISYAMVWRIAERLGDALESYHGSNRYERRSTRLAVERVTKLLLNTMADEPWACHETTNPLHVEVANFRAWHETGRW